MGDQTLATRLVTIDGEEFLQVSIGASVIRATPCLPWDFGEEWASLPSYKAFEYFMLGQDIVQDDTDIMRLSVLHLRASQAKYQNTLQGYTDLGTFDTTYSHADDLQDAIVGSTPKLADEFKFLQATDIAQSESQAQSGTRRRRDAPATEEPTEEVSVRFLAISSVKDLIIEGERPLRHVCRLIGLLGSTCIQRQSEPASSIRVVASLLKHYIITYLKLPSECGSDGVIAASLRQFMAATEPGNMLRSGRADDASTRNEAIDGIRHARPPRAAIRYIMIP